VEEITEEGLDESILKLLQKKPYMSVTEICRALGCSERRRTVGSHVTKLCRQHQLMQVLRADGKPGYVLREMFKEWSEIKHRDRQSHTEDMKKEVVDPWLRDLPVILENSYEIMVTSSNAPYFGQDLELEASFIFKHLRIHFPVLFDYWEAFKESAKTFHKKREVLLGKVDGLLQAEMQLRPSVALARALSSWLLRAAFLQHENKVEEYERHVKLHSRVELHPQGYLQYFDGAICYARSATESSKQDFKGFVEELIRNALERIREPRFQDEVSKVARMLSEVKGKLQCVRDELIRIKHLPIFLGDCDLLT
jgi:predicted DNA-binding transcriptional regulator